MAEYIHLIGAENVEHAGREMNAAAESIRQSVGFFADTLTLHALRMEELVSRLERIAPNQFEPTEGGGEKLAEGSLSAGLVHAIKVVRGDSPEGGMAPGRHGTQIVPPSATSTMPTEGGDK